jgi:hypothetical protein
MADELPQKTSREMEGESGRFNDPKTRLELMLALDSLSNGKR